MILFYKLPAWILTTSTIGSSCWFYWEEFPLILAKIEKINIDLYRLTTWNR